MKAVLAVLVVLALPAFGGEMLESVTFNDVVALEVPAPDAVVPYGDDTNQFGELWLAEGDQRGLVVLIHGGCWLNAYDVGHSRPMASALARRGIAVWSLEYRRIGDPGGGYPGTFDDIELALSRLDLLASRGVDVASPILAGHSAGGHLALWTAARHVTSTAGVVGLGAIADLEAYAAGTSACERATIDLMGGTPGEMADRYALASPARLELHPDTYLVHGRADGIVPTGQVTDLPVADRIVLVDAGHFELIHPETRAFQDVISTIEVLLQ